MAKDVMLKQQLTLSALELPEVDRFSGELNPTRRELRDLSDGDKYVTAPDASLQACHGGITPSVEPDNEILNSTERLAGPISQRAAHDLPETQGRRIHWVVSFFSCHTAGHNVTRGDEAAATA
jgi:hypothetical protein